LFIATAAAAVYGNSIIQQANITWYTTISGIEIKSYRNSNYRTEKKRSKLNSN